jgi:hypothetical protein
MDSYKITIEQIRLLEVDVEANTRKEAEELAHEAVPSVADVSKSNGVRFVFGSEQTLPPTTEFDADKNFDSVGEALRYLLLQRNPFDCLFRYIKHQCYWGEQKFCTELLAAATDIIEAQKGHGY